MGGWERKASSFALLDGNPHPPRPKTEPGGLPAAAEDSGPQAWAPCCAARARAGAAWRPGLTWGTRGSSGRCKHRCVCANVAFFSDPQVRLLPESIPQLAVGVTSQPVAGLDVSLNASEAGSRDVKEVPGNQRCACSSNYIVKCARIVPPAPTHLLEEDPEVDAGSGRRGHGELGPGWPRRHVEGASDCGRRCLSSRTTGALKIVLPVLKPDNSFPSLRTKQKLVKC